MRGLSENVTSKNTSKFILDSDLGADGPPTRRALNARMFVSRFSQFNMIVALQACNKSFDDILEFDSDERGSARIAVKSVLNTRSVLGPLSPYTDAL